MNGVRNRFRLSVGAGAVLGLGILVLVNWIGSRHYRRFDWTGAGLYSLSEKTTNVLKGLKAPVHVTVFMTENTQLFPETQELLKRYRAASPLVTVETIDPTRNKARAEALAKGFGVTGPSVVFKSGERKKYVAVDQLAELDFSRARFGGEPSIKSFKGEQEFTSAILSITQAKTPKVLFTKGHGERPTASKDREGLWAVAETLRRDDCTVEEWSSLDGGDVPAGTDLVVVGGPKTAFTPPEAEALKRYLAGGGRALLLLDPAFAAGRPTRILDLGLSGLLGAWGVRLDDDVVVDPKGRVPLMGAETLFANSFRPHPITKPLEGSAVLLPLARSVRLAEKMPDGVTGTVLLETSAEGWGETDLASLEVKMEKGADDVPGPVSLAVAVESAGARPEGQGQPQARIRLVVVGNSGFAANGAFANAANSFLVSAAANWALEREALVAIAPRSTDQVAVTMTRADIGTMSLVAILLMPALAISLGLAVWFRRRR
jgi:ABC-type uncharacterized transport system involved in gliding motility auxiliary subunit